MKEIDEVLKKVKRVHFIGIGGSGMCPLVEILHSKGYETTTRAIRSTASALSASPSLSAREPRTSRAHR